MSIGTINAILVAYDKRSAVSGSTTNLTIVQLHNTLPLSLLNAIVVTTTEATSAARGFLSEDTLATAKAAMNKIIL